MNHPPPTTLAEAVRRFADAGGGCDAAFSVCVDEFLDAFYTDQPARRASLIAEEPPALGHERRDAYVGAIGEHLARRWGLPIPDWTGAPWREVAQPWFVGAMGVGLSELFLVESPIAFRRRRIFTEAEPLRRARMPREG